MVAGGGLLIRGHWDGRARHRAAAAPPPRPEPGPAYAASCRAGPGAASPAAAGPGPPKTGANVLTYAPVFLHFSDAHFVRNPVIEQ